eukprot:scaffold171951_cov50-Attheya_sp.AAC.2
MALRVPEGQMRFFIGGLGYCGSRLAVRLRQEFPSCEIAGCVRSESRKQSLLLAPNNNDDDESILEKQANVQVHVHVLDLDEDYGGLDEAGIVALQKATHVIQTIAPIADFDRDPFLALHASVLQESPDLQWAGYLSSTGVYGDHGGNWVNEDSELRCQDAKSLARVKAETEWQQLEEVRRRRQNQHNKTRVDCFRCGGIYGPGRSPLFSVLSSSKRGTKSLDGGMDDSADTSTSTPKYVNRILVDDICGALVAAVVANAESNTDIRPTAGTIYNCVDDDPAPRRDVMLEARKLVGAIAPSATDENTAPAPQRPARRRAMTGNKRCHNLRLKDDYGWNLLAPTYREGLAYLLKQHVTEEAMT